MSTEQAAEVPAKREYKRYGFDSLVSGDVSAIEVSTANSHRASSAAWAFSKRHGVKLSVSKSKSDPSVTVIRVAPSTSQPTATTNE